MKKIHVLIVSVVVILIVGIYFVSNKKSETVSFNVGLITILSGDYAAVGENFKNGVVLANEQYNSLHKDSPVNLIVEDDGFSGGKGVSAYQILVNVDKVDALINVSTPTIDSIYDMVIKSGLPVVQGGEQGREPTDDNVFGIYPDSIASEYDYGVYMRNKGVTNMVLVYTNIDAMIRFVSAFKKGFQGSVTEIVIDAGEKDFRTHALKASQGSNKNIGIFMFPEQGAKFINEYLKLAKVKPDIFFDTSFVTGITDYERILGDLSILNDSIVGGMKLDSTNEFKVAYKARYGTDAGFLADIGYDSFNLLVETHSSDWKTWNSKLKNSSVSGASGKIKFGETGNRLPETKMMIIKGGKLADL